MVWMLLCVSVVLHCCILRYVKIGCSCVGCVTSCVVFMHSSKSLIVALQFSCIMWLHTYNVWFGKREFYLSTATINVNLCHRQLFDNNYTVMPACISLHCNSPLQGLGCWVWDVSQSTGGTWGSSQVGSTECCNGIVLSGLSPEETMMLCFHRCIRFDDRRIVSGAYDG